MKTYGKYKDCIGNERDIDEFHIHELLDRVHVLRDTFHSHISDHPASKLFSDEIEAISEKLGDLYQHIGKVR